VSPPTEAASAVNNKLFRGISMWQSILHVFSIVLGMSAIFSIAALGGASLYYFSIQNLFGRKGWTPSPLRKIMVIALYAFWVSILTTGLLIALELFETYPIYMVFGGVLVTFVLTASGSFISLNLAEKIRS
jgi:hypothetical protein